MASVVEAAKLTRRELQMLGQNVIDAVEADRERGSVLDRSSDELSASDTPGRPATKSSPRPAA